MTLEELGYKFIEEKTELFMFAYQRNRKKVTWQLYQKDDNKLYLYSFGDVDVEYLEDYFITQALHKAIELKMKELGWWK